MKKTIYKPNNGLDGEGIEKIQAEM